MLCADCKNNDVCKYKTTIETFENDIVSTSAETKIVVSIQCKEKRVK